MNLLEKLKEIPEKEQNLDVFLRMSTVVGNIRSVDLVSSKIFKNNNSFCQVISLRNSDFDEDYANYFQEAKGVKLEVLEDEELENLEIDIISSIKELIEAIELNIRSDIKDIKYSATTALSGKEFHIVSINKDTYHTFGSPDDCYIIEIK